MSIKNGGSSKRPPQSSKIDSVKSVVLLFTTGEKSLLEVDVSDQWLKLWSPRNSHIQSFGSEESLEVKQVEVIEIHQVGEQLIGQAV